MLAAMTHPSRVLNLDMKAKALYAKELYIYIYQLTEDSDKEHNWYHAAKWGIEKSVCN